MPSSQIQGQPILETLTAPKTYSGVSSIAISSTVGATTVAANGSISLTEGLSIEFTADGGNGLGDITITPAGTALVAYFP
jgi:hypothetical protein